MESRRRECLLPKRCTMKKICGRLSFTYVTCHLQAVWECTRVSGTIVGRLRRSGAWWRDPGFSSERISLGNNRFLGTLRQVWKLTSKEDGTYEHSSVCFCLQTFRSWLPAWSSHSGSCCPGNHFCLRRQSSLGYSLLEWSPRLHAGFSGPADDPLPEAQRPAEPVARLSISCPPFIANNGLWLQRRHRQLRKFCHRLSEPKLLLFQNGPLP